MPNNGSLVRIYHPNLTPLQINRRIICSLPYDPISLGQPRSHPQLFQLHHHSLGHLLLVAEDLLNSFHLLHLEDLLHVEEALFTNSYMRLSQALMMDWQATLKQWLTWNQMPFSHLVLCALCTLDQRGAWLRWPTEISENMKSNAKGWNSRDFETWV